MAADPTKYTDVTLSVDQLNLLIGVIDAAKGPWPDAELIAPLKGLRTQFTLALQDCQRRAEKRATSLSKSQHRTQAHETENSDQTQAAD